MTRLSYAFLLTAITFASLSACDVELTDAEIALRDGDITPPPWPTELDDECILINEPPDTSGNTGNEPPDPEIDAPTGGDGSSGGDGGCTDPAGCVDPPSGGDGGCTDPAGCVDAPDPKTWPDGIGGIIVVPGACPEWQPNPTVVATTPSRALLECVEQYGSLCEDVCACHGGVPDMSSSGPTACLSTQDLAGNTLPPGTYHCGCVCDPPPP